MKHLKQLRESMRYSQQQLAERLRTTQQTIDKWESGKSEPGLAELRGLAMIFGVSVDELLGIDPLQDSPATPDDHRLTGDAQDGFWGHVGLKLDGGPSKWFPVTVGVANQVRSGLEAVEDASAWVSFPTLANRYVAFRPSVVKKVWLLDDACDGPVGDWEHDLPFEGLPLEMYRAFHALYGVAPPDEWTAALRAAPSRDCEGGGAVWDTMLARLRPAFEGEVSDAFLSAVASRFGAMELFDDDKFFRDMHDTTVHFVDGALESFWVEERCVASFLFDADLEQPPMILRLETANQGADVYYPTDRVAAIVTPLIGLLDAWKAEDEEIEAE